MNKNQFIANAEITIKAPVAKVWDALINPVAIKAYMFGTEVVSDWQEDSPIVWKGEWEGKNYEDRGQVIKIVPMEELQYTHFSPMGGQDDVPENYHTVTAGLNEENNYTHVVLTQDNNSSREASNKSEENWKQMLEGLKQYVEGNK